MNATIVFQQMVIMFMLMGLGFVLARRKVFSTKAPSDFSKLIIEVCNPVLMISSALNRDGTASKGDLLLAVLIAVIYFAVLIGLGKIIPRLARVKKSEFKFYQLLGVYGNIGFMGIPLISAVLGTSAIIYLTVFIIMFNLLAYTHGVGVLTGDLQDAKSKFEWRRMVNHGTIAAAV